MSEISWKRFYSTGMNVPVKDNFYYSLFMRGQRSSRFPSPDYLLPPYLTMDGFTKLKVFILTIRSTYCGSALLEIAESLHQNVKILIMECFTLFS